MHPDIVSLLLDLNRQFYHSFARSFSATRQRIQPGVARLLLELPLAGRWLDLGCGNGELGRVLAERGFEGEYIGLDFSVEFIEEARRTLGVTGTKPHPPAPSPRSGEGEESELRRLASSHGSEDELSNRLPSILLRNESPASIQFPPPLHSMERGPGGEAGASDSASPAKLASSFSFLLSDLSTPHWSDPFPPSSFNRILAFSALHHLPGLALRLHVLRQARLLLKEGGLFVHSEWQFQHSPRLVGRIQPWERLGLTPADLEEGDFLLDWRAEKDPAAPPALRYVHRFSLAELAHLAEQSGFEILETFESDGQGGRLGLYQVWKAI